MNVTLPPRTQGRGCSGQDERTFHGSRFPAEGTLISAYLVPHRERQGKQQQVNSGKRTVTSSWCPGRSEFQGLTTFPAGTKPRTPRRRRHGGGGEAEVGGGGGDHRQSDLRWDCFSGNVGETCESRGSTHTGRAERADVAFWAKRRPAPSA